MIPIVLLLVLAGWILSSAYYMMYSLFVRNDGMRDVQARHEMGINTGRERLAQLVVTMGTYKAWAFGIWLLCGLYFAYEITPWGREEVHGPWRNLIIPVCLIVGQQLIGRSLLRFHTERKRVLDTDRQHEQQRLLAAARVTAQSLDNNTAALNSLTDATNAVTDTMQQRNDMRADMEG
jgi:hypothetical protein